MYVLRKRIARASACRSGFLLPTWRMRTTFCVVFLGTREVMEMDILSHAYLLKALYRIINYNQLRVQYYVTT